MSLLPIHAPKSRMKWHTIFANATKFICDNRAYFGRIGAHFIAQSTAYAKNYAIFNPTIFIRQRFAYNRADFTTQTPFTTRVINDFALGIVLCF